MISVCTDCTDRCVGCHGKCEKYAAERAERDRLLQERNKQKRADYEMCGYRQCKADRLRKSHARRKS